MRTQDFQGTCSRSKSNADRTVPVRCVRRKLSRRRPPSPRARRLASFETIFELHSAPPPRGNSRPPWTFKFGCCCALAEAALVLVHAVNARYVRFLRALDRHFSYRSSRPRHYSHAPRTCRSAIICRRTSSRSFRRTGAFQVPYVARAAGEVTVFKNEKIRLLLGCHGWVRGCGFVLNTARRLHRTMTLSLGQLLFANVVVTFLSTATTVQLFSQSIRLTTVH